MKTISFKILVLFIILPPMLYLTSISVLEMHFNDQYTREVKNIYLSDITNILNGLTDLKDGINDSIETYLHDNFFVKLGGKIDISIATKQGNIIYPSIFQQSALNNPITDPVILSQNNFNALNEGLEIFIEVKIKHYSFIALSILMFYVLIFLCGLYGYYRRITKKIQMLDLKKNEELNRLHTLEQDHLEQIDTLSGERQKLMSDYDQLQMTLKKEKVQAEKTEDDLFDEVEVLEKKLQDNLSLQQLQYQQIDKLKEEINEVSKKRSAINKQKDKAVDKLTKRFKVLYKNIELTHKAIESLIRMTEDMSLKAEEVIHQLNSDPSLVPVKRKVFSKKGRGTIFEVVFAYNGRLYFRKATGNRVEIPTIGTKNTQTKDLIFLDNI